MKTYLYLNINKMKIKEGKELALVSAVLVWFIVAMLLLPLFFTLLSASDTILNIIAVALIAIFAVLSGKFLFGASFFLEEEKEKKDDNVSKSS